MSKPMKYLIVDVDNGKWNWSKNSENHSIAVPKMLNNLEIRIDRLIDSVFKSVEKGMIISFHNRDKHTKKLCKKIDNIKEEMSLHYFMFSDFRRKVEEILETDHSSPLISLKKMDSPLSRKKNYSFHLYERVENEDIVPKFKQFDEYIRVIQSVLDVVRSSWIDIISLYTEIDPEILLTRMKIIRKSMIINWDDLGSLTQYLEKVSDKMNTFFIIDDVTKGVLKKGIRLKINLSDLSNKFNDMMIRTLLKGCLHFRKSEEQRTIENLLLRMKELDLYNVHDMNTQVLLDVKLMLDVESHDDPSSEMCYKKIGELHTNIHNKIFVLKIFNLFRPILNSDTISMLDIFSDELEKIHSLLALETVDGKELEMYIKVIEDLIMQSVPGNEYFTLNTKLHNKHLLLKAQYNTLDPKHLEKCLEVLASESFQKMIKHCESFIIELKNENKKREDVGADLIEKFGLATGKTTMINSYSKVIDEISATLGTFISNTLHVLVQEILMNIQIGHPLRKDILRTYKTSENSLKNLDTF